MLLINLKHTMNITMNLLLASYRFIDISNELIFESKAIIRLIELLLLLLFIE